MVCRFATNGCNELVAWQPDQSSPFNPVAAFYPGCTGPYTLALNQWQASIIHHQWINVTIHWYHLIFCIFSSLAWVHLEISGSCELWFEHWCSPNRCRFLLPVQPSVSFLCICHIARIHLESSEWSDNELHITHFCPLQLCVYHSIEWWPFCLKFSNLHIS